MKRLLLLTVACISFGDTAGGQRGAKALFYDAGPEQPPAVQAPSSPAGLRAIRTGEGVRAVGVHYWFENRARQPLSERGAANSDAELTLHVRANVEGFLSVWHTDDGRVQLAPGPGGASAYLVGPGQECVTARAYRFTATDAGQLFLVFSRSETEQVNSAASAREKLESRSLVFARRGETWLVREADEATPAGIGTYVVSPRGAPVVTEIKLLAR